MRTRIPKTIDQKLRDLDSHLFLLREHLYPLRESPSHLKVIAAELRTLVCFSSGIEGLLLRLVEEFQVDDRLFLHVIGKLKQDHPLAQGLHFAVVPIQRGGKGHPHLPAGNYSLKKIIKDCEALVVGGQPITHEYLIKAVAQQMGTAHEDEGLEPALVDLKAIFVRGVEPFIPVLAIDAELTLEIGERVLEAAERKLNFERQPHEHDYGNVSVVTRFRVKQYLAGRVPLFRFHSYVSDIDISGAAGPSGIAFALSKHGSEIVELVAKYPDDWSPGDDAVFVLSYSSRTQQARTITNGQAAKITNGCNAGWFHAGDLVLEETHADHIELVEMYYLLNYGRLLSSQDSKGLYELPPDGYGLWKYSDELEEQGVFPD